MGDLRFQVLGPLAVERDGQAVALGSPQARAVLALLLVDAGQVVSVDRLIDALWPEMPPPSARVQVQGHISGLRRAFGDANSTIVTQSPGYRLRLASGALDLDVFQQETAAARALLAAGDTGAAAGRFAAALAHWRGVPYAGIDLPLVRRAADRLDELRLAALGEQIDVDLALCRPRVAGDLVAELRALVDANPLREGFRGQLMVVLARTGRVAEALEEYRRARRLLVGELGIEPSEQLRAVHAQILRAEPGFRPGDAKPARRPTVVPRELPADIGDFTGREELLAEVRATLAAPHRPVPPVVAITGAGGVGKTTLLVHAAHRLVDCYPDGQLFVLLHGASPDPVTPAAALARLLRGLGVSDAAMPADLEDRAALYRSLLAGRRVLVALDDARDEEQVRPLLPAAPDSGVLVTSRRRLGGLAGLRAVPVDVLSTEDSVTMLSRIVGAEQVAAQPAAATATARHCGGLPLAVRIVGSRLANRPQWTISDLERRLTDERERLDWLTTGDLGVRASLALSYRQLGAAHQRLFRRLGLLDAPDFASWVAAAVLGATSGPAERLLEDLVDCHLVEPAGHSVTGPRYRLHDLLRLLARELAQADEPTTERDAARDRALAGWLALAGRADDALLRFALDPYPVPSWQPPADLGDAAHADPAGWFADERAALLVAVRQAADAGRASLAWPLAMRLSSYLSSGGPTDEWRRVLDAALTVATFVGDQPGVAAMHRLMAEVEILCDDLAAARAALDRAQRPYREVSAWHSDALLLPRMALMRFKEDDLDGATSDYVTALAAAQRLGDPLVMAYAHYGLVVVHAMRESLDSLLEEYATLLAEFEAIGGVGVGMVLYNLGLSLRRAGRHSEAERRFREALHVFRRLGDERWEAFTGTSLARLYVQMGRLHEAATLAEETLAWFRTVTDRYGIGRSLYALGSIAKARGDLATAAERFRDALAIWRDLDLRWYLRQCMSALADVCLELGDFEAHAVYEEELRHLDTEPANP